jgi:hypothetical protein
MRAEYDSEADAVSIDLIEAPNWDGADAIDGDCCTVALAGGQAANVELLSPAEHVELLQVAAERHGLDAQALEAAARSALAAPDRSVILDVGASA